MTLARNEHRAHGVEAKRTLAAAHVYQKQTGGGDIVSAAGLAFYHLELQFESELILPWNVVRICCRNRAEGRVAERLVAAVVVRYEEVRRVGDVEGFHAELHVHTLSHREVFEKR